MCASVCARAHARVTEFRLGRLINRIFEIKISSIEFIRLPLVPFQFFLPFYTYKYSKCSLLSLESPFSESSLLNLDSIHCNCRFFNQLFNRKKICREYSLEMPRTAFTLACPNQPVPLLRFRIDSAILGVHFRFSTLHSKDSKCAARAARASNTPSLRCSGD